MVSFPDIAAVLCGICLGTAGGYTVAYITVPDTPPSLQGALRSERPHVIELRATVASYDPETRILTAHALNPYAGNTVLPLAIHITERTGIVYGPDIDETPASPILKAYADEPGTPEQLTPGRRVYIFLDRTQLEFTAAFIRIFARE